MATDSPIRVAILGASGRQGKRRADAVTRVPGMSLAYLADIPQATAALQELSTRYQCPSTSDWEAAVSDKQVDAVVVCTPNSKHVEMALKALQQGKHVLVEKPLANSVAECAELTREADRAQLVLRTGFNYPFRTPIQHGLELFAQGAIGKLLGFRAIISHSQFMGQAGGNQWFCQPGLAGHGAWMDLGIHMVDLAHHVISSVGDQFSTVSAQISEGRVIRPSSTEATLEEECVALYRTRDGRLVSIQASWVEVRPFLGARIELIGDNGRIDIDLGNRVTKIAQRHENRVVESQQEFPYVDPDPSWATEMTLFRDLIQSPQRRGEAGAVGLKVQRLAFAAYESAHADGQSVSLAAAYE
ncbi:MAG: Gfo/Idh/MocA family oxidoreductase [Planctomycetes bacterium]|nr:Gfo/Idh/MocA family oxidoreductase [Planctomycetota bacterium]